MPPYKESQPGRNDEQKFIRLNESIITDYPEFTHLNIAKNNGILPDLEKIKKQNPNQADAGFYLVRNEMIYILGNSETLGLPISDKAREITKELFREKSPKHQINML